MKKILQKFSRGDNIKYRNEGKSSFETVDNFVASMFTQTVFENFLFPTICDVIFGTISDMKFVFVFVKKVGRQ